MIEILKNVLLIIGALFPIVNPIGGSPVFLSLTSDYSPQSRRLLAWRVSLNSFVLLVASFAIGTHVLSFLRHFAAGSSSGRRIGCHLHRLGDVEAKRRRRARLGS